MPVRMPSFAPCALPRLACQVLLLCGLAMGPVAASAAPDASAESALRMGAQLRQQGQLSLAIGRLRQAQASAATDEARMRVSAELGAALLQARQLDAAEAVLVPAYGFLQGEERARVALDLGNLVALRGGSAEAARFYEEALRLGSRDPQISHAARLNQARLAGPDARLAALTALAAEIARLPEGPAKARAQINLGQQARGIGESGRAPAYAALDAAQRWATAGAPGDAQRTRLGVEALDALAQLYEDGERPADALRLNSQALALADRLPSADIGDLGILLPWRQARLAQAQGQPSAALAGWRRAVRQIELLRQDIPIDDDNGGSSFRALLEPVYLGLVDSLLAVTPEAGAPQPGGLLREAVDTVELVHQAELQDYLGDRCEVDSVKGGTPTVIPPGAAVLYTVLLGDRLELLVQTSSGITRHRSAAPPQELRDLASQFARQLRTGAAGFQAPARQLYDWLLRPVQARLAGEAVRTLVVVPDSALRLVAFGALHDGERYAIERYAMASATGMSMTHTAPAGPVPRGVLLAGMSDPGPVVDKLQAGTVARILSGPPAGAARGLARTRALGISRSAAPTATEAALRDAAARSRDLREALALPGVRQEVAAIAGIGPARQLMNQDFTLQGFSRAAESGRYGIIHVASHGVFGGSADDSYILAYDALLTLDGLQSLLRSDPLRRNPVELLSLSACETAEGDERSPLGLSGAALKARARAVMGSLWPVADEASVGLMQSFYGGLLREHLPKAQALQQAQVAMLRTPATAHPFYWAPFILIGNWH